PHLALAMTRHGEDRIVHHVVDGAALEIVYRVGRGPVRHLYDVKLEDVLHQSAGDLPGRRGRAVARLRALSAHRRDQARHVLVRTAGRDAQREWQPADAAEDVERAWLVAGILEQRLAGADRARRMDHDGVAVRLGFRHVVEGEIAGRADLVLDHHRAAEER